MKKKISYMSINEFRKEGFLQEVNRRFFHPLGLALEVRVNDNGEESLGGIWDYRSDPEGMKFGRGMLDRKYYENINKLWSEKFDSRRRRLGYMTQPMPKEKITKEDKELELKITVCDKCFMASCWQCKFMCDNALNAGITQKTIKELQTLNLEHPSYWKTDEELNKEAEEHNY